MVRGWELQTITIVCYGEQTLRYIDYEAGLGCMIGYASLNMKQGICPCAHGYQSLFFCRRFVLEAVIFYFKIIILPPEFDPMQQGGRVGKDLGCRQMCTAFCISLRLAWRRKRLTILTLAQWDQSYPLL